MKKTYLKENESRKLNEIIDIILDQEQDEDILNKLKDEDKVWESLDD